MKLAAALSALALLISMAVVSQRREGASAPAPAAEWRFWGGDPGGTRFSSLADINRSNVARLRRLWTYHTGEWQEGTRQVALECTPLVVGGVLYLSTPSNRIVALNDETGAAIWRFDPHASAPKRGFEAHRGVAYWEGTTASGKRQRRILSGTYDGRLFALDAETGRPASDFGDGGSIDLRLGVAERWPSFEYAVTSPPAIYRDLVITGAALPEGPGLGPSGAVRAFDVRSGKQVWRFETIPGPGEPGHDTWEGDSWRDRTGVNVWSIMSVDPERGLVFLPTGSPAYDFYGGDRRGQNLFANSLVALDAATGKRVWHFQMVHHDVWDYDLPAQPVLVDFVRGGQRIAAVVQVTKMGLVFVLDRRTGQPVFPVEERPVPPSRVAGETTWPTQPIPAAPPALSRQSITREELSRVTPESARECSALFDQLKRGPVYTPYGVDPTLVLPGTLGGATWSGASFDPATGYLYVNTNETGAIGRMAEQPAGSRYRFRRTSPGGEYARFLDSKRRPCVAPPWGLLHAIDLRQGTIAWQAPLGIVEDLEAKGVPKTGTSNLGGSIVTAGGLVFIAATNDSRFRAFDARTGEELWVTRLEAGGHATPITYRASHSGRQIVVIAAGGGGYFSDTSSDVVAAYALPD
jgi:quinoprotein glucose dehydrogenase